MIKDLVQKNRSYRGYDESRKVTREELVHLVECARLAPSSVNMQPLRYYLIHTQEELDLLQPLTNYVCYRYLYFIADRKSGNRRSRIPCNWNAAVVY